MRMEERNKEPLFASFHNYISKVRKSLTRMIGKDNIFYSKKNLYLIIEILQNMRVISCDISFVHNLSSERITHNTINDIDYMEIVQNNPNKLKRLNLDTSIV